jgi:hypothetical protein
VKVTADNTSLSIDWLSSPVILNTTGRFGGLATFKVGNGKSGVIIQQVTFSASDVLFSPTVPTYWESWSVTNGIVSPTDAFGANDEFIAPNANYSVTGLVQFFPGATMAAFPGLAAGGTFAAAAPSGNLPSSYTMPSNWTPDGALVHQIIIVTAPTPSGFRAITTPP